MTRKDLDPTRRTKTTKNSGEAGDGWRQDDAADEAPPVTSERSLDKLDSKVTMLARQGLYRMPSFLVTRKMSPELAARVQASVEGRRVGAGAKLAPLSRALLRLTVFAAIISALVAFFVSRRRATDKLDADRSALLERVRRHSGSLSQAEKATASRVVPMLTRAAGAYEGDFISPELRGNGASGLATKLARPTLYVRGPLPSFRGASSIREHAASSSNDAFVLCLLDPPSDKSEKLVRAKARASHAHGPQMQRIKHVERLYDAFAGLPFLTREWEDRVVEADRRKFDQLKRNFDLAPIEGAKRAAKAPLLLFAIDEPSSKGPVELDGERPHDVRVGLIDLLTGKTLLRLRRHVDPSWISEASRAQYASAMDSCVLALEVHAAVSSTLSARTL